MRDLLDRLYREHAGRLHGALTRLCGAGRMELVEASVHEAFAAALVAWPTSGAPDNPAGWLHTAARNRALDVLRRESRFPADQPDEYAAAAEPADAHLREELPDDLLAMIFVACHPALPLESQVALTLRTLCGLELPAIARALLQSEAAIDKRLVRARQLLREANVDLEPPGAAARRERLDAVLAVLYLLFSEGYAAHHGESAMRADLCGDAIRLAETLADHPATEDPRVHALCALMHLQASRLAARVDAEGHLVTLADQDRTRWDRRAIGRGLLHLAASAGGDDVSAYHLEAGIAACHATAPSFDDTDWRRIVDYYDQLLALDPSPVVAVNRAIAIGFADGPDAGLSALGKLEREPRLAGSPLVAAAAADLRARAGDLHRARAAYQRAIELASSDQERRWLERRLAELS